MRISFLIGAALIVVIVAGVAWFSLRPSPTTDEVGTEEAMEEVETGNGEFFQAVPATTTAGDPAEADGVSISVSETGFSPAAVTVAAGTTVTFVNNGQAAHWPASDLHPTHEILPGFDAKRGLGTGETYSYTFADVGTWRCHDHLLPANTCTITVE